MPANILICAYIADRNTADLVSRLCAAQGWSVWLRDGEKDNALDIAQLPKSPEIIIFDRPDRQSAVTLALDHLPAAHAIYIGPADAGALPGRFSRVAHSDIAAMLCSAVTKALNIARFDHQFFQAQAAEPITKLPHHQELLEFMLRHTGDPTGLMVVQIDHAEHLYANLDPVSKTDLLSALSDHLLHSLPANARLGIYDAASFVVWCPGSELAAMQSMADELVACGKTPLNFRGGLLHFSFSIGFAHDNTLADPQHLYQVAWQAMEKARADGGNTAIAAAGESDVSRRIPVALNRDEFALALQPQWDITGTELRGVEALLRWEGLEVGNLDPEHFIPIAERSGQMARVGDWVLERACCESATWLEHLITPILLGINVSPQQFVNGAIVNQIERLSRDQWLDPSILELELSHDNLLHLVDRHRAELFKLRDMGVRVAIDNLGTGVVDTNKLLRCPADTLKIDRALIHQIEDDGDARTLVEQICQVGERFRLRIVAVGVETEGQRAMLEHMGCTDAQGYLLSNPVPLKEFQKFLGEAMSDIARRASH